MTSSIHEELNRIYASKHRLQKLRHIIDAQERRYESQIEIILDRQKVADNPCLDPGEKLQ